MRERSCFATCLGVFFCLIFQLNALAQKQLIKFRHISYREGLLQSPVSTLVQDSEGYIWVGSWGGLSRYDGSTFKPFRHTDTTIRSISHNRINRIFEDRKKNLWIGTGNGLNLYKRTTEKFQHVGISTAKGGANFITAITDDSYGQVWVATFKGLKYVSESQDDLHTVPAWKTTGPELFEGITFSLFEDSRRHIWVGVNQGLKRFDPRTKKVLPLPEVLKDNKVLSAAKIVVIKEDRAGELWFGTEEDGLFRYSPSKNTCIRYVNNENNSNTLPSNWVNDILVKDSTVWIATRNGLAIFDIRTNTFSNYNHDSASPRTLSDDSVWSLMQDRTSNIWIGTYSGGLNIYFPGNANFSNIGEQVGNNVGLNKPLANALVAEPDGGLWIGTFGGGINYINREKGIAHFYSVCDLKNGKYSNEVKSLEKDASGNLWAGTLDGLCRFNPSNKTVQYINFQTINNKTGRKLVNAIVADKDGLWVGTNGAGLKFVSYDGRELQTFINNPKEKNSLCDNYVNAILKDGTNLWIGTQNGLNRYDVVRKTFSTFKRSKKEGGLSYNNIVTLFKDSRGRLWVGTDGGGLNCFDVKQEKASVINQATGLADDVIASIIEDDSGNLWISTNNGLSRITLTKTSFPIKKQDYKVENYSSSNGLQSNQFLTSAGVKTHNGEILFGGMNGVTAFFSGRIIKNRYKPGILLTTLIVNNSEVSLSDNSVLKQPLNQTENLTLRYNENNLTIKFSALNFINPERNTYAFKMKGLNNNEHWQIIGNRKDVSFTNLEPGKYVFYVKAANNDGVWNETGRMLNITVLPPFWQTWWAYCIYISIISGTAYKVIQFFRFRAKLERDLYNEHLENERQQEFYRMKLDFFTNISHEIRTPLTLISGPVESLYNATRENPTINKQILQIKNNSERLLRLIGELMDFRKAETGNMTLYVQKNNLVPFLREIFYSFTPLAESRNIQYEFICTREDVQAFTDRDQLEKVFFNLLSNAFKFTDNKGRISVELIADNESYVEIKVKDNGKGIPVEHQQKLFTNFYQVQPDKSKPGTGVGLALSKSIVELHNGRISVRSVPAKPGSDGETVFSVQLPYTIKSSDHVNIIEANMDVENIASFKLQSEIDVFSSGPEIKVDKRYTVLLAEDNHELRHFIADSLPAYEIVSCENGALAWESATERIPDLIISDVMMPEMNGLELCRKIKTDERTSHIPVILLTALAAHIHQVNGFQTGADAYLTKPFSTRLLELNVHNMLASREVMRRKFAQQVVLEPQNLPINNTEEKFIKKLMQIIDDKMEDPEFGVLELGSEIGMSKTVLYKKICALTDLSPSDFIKSMRLKKAAMLLQQGGYNVNEVSAMVGFNDRKYFSREFKKYHGMAPSEVSAADK